MSERKTVRNCLKLIEKQLKENCTKLFVKWICTVIKDTLRIYGKFYSITVATT